MTRARGEIPEPEEALLGIERPSIEDEASEQKRAVEKAEIRRRYLTSLMQQGEFRRWLMEQLVGFETFGSPFGISPSGFPDPLATQFRLGMKAAGWHLWEQFDEIAPELASLMRREWRDMAR